MNMCPLRYQRKNTRRKRTFDNISVLDGNLCAVPLVTYVKMRWAVIIEIHRNHNPKEPTDLWHLWAVIDWHDALHAMRRAHASRARSKLRKSTPLPR